MKKSKLSRQQRRIKYKLTGKELEDLKEKERLKAIEYTVNIFEKVMHKEFGFGKKRMGRIAKAIYEELGIL